MLTVASKRMIHQNRLRLPLHRQYYSPALKSWKRLSHEATATNNRPKQEESCDHSASSSCTLRTKQQECQFNAMLCDGFAMETLFGCFLLQSCLLLTSCRNAHLLMR